MTASRARCPVRFCTNDVRSDRGICEDHIRLLGRHDLDSLLVRGHPDDWKIPPEIEPTSLTWRQAIAQFRANHPRNPEQPWLYPAEVERLMEGFEARFAELEAIEQAVDAYCEGWEPDFAILRAVLDSRGKKEWGTGK